MTWFKVDDKLPDNRKTRAIRKSHPSKRRDASAFGIWTLAGAWSNDGWVPLEILEDWDDDAEALADRLVRAGLWHRADRAGEPGFVFHDWHDQNPANGDNDPSTSGTFGNHVRWHVQRKIVADDCDHCPKEPDEAPIGANQGDIAPDDRGDGGEDRPDLSTDRGESLPSRPDPTRDRPEPNPETLLPDTSGDTDGLDRFDEFWDTYGKKVDRKACERLWRNALRKRGVTADYLIAAAVAYVVYERVSNQGGRFIMDPARWLRNERWNDERPVVEAPRTNTQSHLSLVEQLAAEEQQTIREIGGGR